MSRSADTPTQAALRKQSKTREASADPELGDVTEVVALDELIANRRINQINSPATMTDEVMMNTESQRIALSAQIAKMMVRGLDLNAIAAQSKLKLSTATSYVRRIEAEWKNSMLAGMDIVKAREMAKLDHIENEAWEQWEASKNAKRKVQIKSVIVGDDREPSGSAKLPTEQKQFTEERLGDPRFMDIIFRCITMRVKLLGLEEVQAGANSGDGPSGNLTERQAVYLTLISPTAHFSPAAPLASDDIGEPLDSERPALETGGVLDTTGYVR